MLALRKWLVTGLLVVVPLAITAGVLAWVIQLLDQTLAILPDAWHPSRLLGFHIPGLGALLTLAILLGVGAVASNFFGSRLVSLGDALVRRIPVVRGIYSSVKQVSDTVFSDSGNAFRTAVLVQWPRAGVWTLAFVTGAPGGEVARRLGQVPLGPQAAGMEEVQEFVSVYIPTTPNPTSGYFVLLPKSECIALDMGVDAALKYIISMGVVAPHPPRNSF